MRVNQTYVVQHFMSLPVTIKNPITVRTSGVIEWSGFFFTAVLSPKAVKLADK